MFTLTGKVALVTGGNSGIGLAMARGLAAAGAAVAIAGRNHDKNSDVAAELAALGVGTAALQADVSDEASCRALADETASRLGGVDILINNAGTNIRKAPETYSLDEWRTVLDT